MSLIPFPDISFLSPGGDIDKGRNRADQDSTTAFDFQHISFAVSCEGPQSHSTGPVCTVQFLEEANPSSGTSYEQTNKMYKTKILCYTSVRWSSFRQVCSNFVLLAIRRIQINVSKNLNYSTLSMKVNHAPLLLHRSSWLELQGMLGVKKLNNSMVFSVINMTQEIKE